MSGVFLLREDRESIIGFSDMTFSQQYNETLFYHGSRHVSLGLLQTDNSVKKINTFTPSLTVCHGKKMNAEKRAPPAGRQEKTIFKHLPV